MALSTRCAREIGRWLWLAVVLTHASAATQASAQTGAKAKPVPAKPVPATPAPVTPAPVTPAPVTPAPVSAGPGSYAGSYQASAALIQSEVSAWGVDCGVQPQSYTASERPLINVGVAGSHLVIGYPDRKLRTDQCWSPNPVVKLASATAADDRWRSECRTPKGEGKQEVGRYTVTATGPYTLELREESDYDWQLKSSHCVATVRITQKLERVPQERAKQAEAAVDPKLKATAAPAPPPCIPGTATRLRIRPLDARIEPGQRVCFTVQGVDAKDCAGDLLMSSMRWELKKPAAARATLADGCFRAAAGAADAEGTFHVTVIRDELRAEASVSVVAPDLSDITARRGATAPTVGPAGTAPQPAVRSTSETSVQAGAVKPRAATTTWILAGMAALAMLGGGVLALRFKRKAIPAARISRQSSLPMAAPRDPVALPPRATPAPAPAIITPEQVASSAPPQAAAGEPMICPTCRRGYAPGSAICEGDRTPLIAYAEFVRRAKEAEATSMAACPGCGTKVAAGSVFCGACGSRLSS